MPSLLKVEHLSVDYPAGSIWRRRHLQAVAEVSFSIAAGETYAIAGESGSGKTTLLRALAGLIPISRGSLLFNGEPITDYSHLRKKIAVMFQDPIGSLSPRCTVRTLLSEPFIIHGIKRREARAEVPRLLEMVGLSADFAARYPHQLSGGQARRVGVARALALSPQLVLADEPTAGLDVSVQGELLNLLNELREKTGMAMMLITHNLHVIRHVADRVGIMYLGRFIEEGKTADIYEAPRHPYTLCLLSANTTGRRLVLHGEVPTIHRRPSGCEFYSRCPFAEKPLCLEAPAWSNAADNARGWRCWKPLDGSRDITADSQSILEL